MGLDFRIRDFAYPLSLLKLKREFDKNQWQPEAFLKEYQRRRLHIVLSHAQKNVPYYREEFQKIGISENNCMDAASFNSIPYLTKEMLRENFKLLTSQHARRFTPLLTSTSGSTGGSVHFYVDKTSNVLEFVFYWRAWGWAGYRIGDVFSELSVEHFSFNEKRRDSFYDYEHLSRRLLINSLFVSRKNIDIHIGIFKRYKPKFLKGLPSNLYALALICDVKKSHGISFRAVFSQGENLLEYQRKLIERVFCAKVYDLYGHMERAVAITQCEYGSYHVHTDYGLVEFLPPLQKLESPSTKDEYVAEIVGTSLHNFAMPLIRYRTGDLVRLYKKPKGCLCGRTLPVVKGIIGRDCDVVITEDGRVITALYVAFDRTKGLALGQVIQEKADSILVRVAPLEGCGYSDEELLSNLRALLGTSMNIQIVHETVEQIRRGDGKKFKVIDSSIPLERIL